MFSSGGHKHLCNGRVRELEGLEKTCFSVGQCQKERWERKSYALLSKDEENWIELTEVHGHFPRFCK